jgi:hypothetical protein
MKKGQMFWGIRPQKGSNSKVSEFVKLELERRAKELIDTVLKPSYVKPPPEDLPFNYIVDIYTLWHGRYFYFCAKYRRPGPNAISPFFESRFARMEYVEKDSFNLSYMRYTGKWVMIFEELSMDECLEAIREQHFFYIG